MNNVLMQNESRSYNNFIIFFVGYFYFMDLIFILDSLIKYKLILKIKINKTSVNTKYIL